NRYDRRCDLPLHSQAKHCRSRRSIVVSQDCHCRREGLGGCESGYSARVRVREVNVRRRWLIRERRVRRGVIYVAAVEPLIEDANAAANDRLAITARGVGEPHSGLQRVDAVLHVAAWEAI